MSIYFLGERMLSPGAAVLSDKGILCIDEFEKLREVDRVCLHDVMESGIVHISKANIQTTFSASASILAAANPMGGFWNKNKTPLENISLPASLLSRFDLVFVMRDIKNKAQVKFNIFIYDFICNF